MIAADLLTGHEWRLFAVIVVALLVLIAFRRVP